MNLHSKTDFKKWCKKHGFTFDPQSHLVEMFKMSGHSVTVRVPETIRGLPYLLEFSFAHLPRWSACQVLKRDGTWYSLQEGSRLKETIHDQMIASLQIPRDYVGSLEFQKAEFPQLALLLFISLFSASGQSDDVSVAPDTGAWALLASHHDYMIFDFLHQSSRDAFETKMKEEEFDLIEWTKKTS